jgi:hypothetical protein
MLLQCSQGEEKESTSGYSSTVDIREGAHGPDELIRVYIAERCLTDDVI